MFEWGTLSLLSVCKLKCFAVLMEVKVRVARVDESKAKA